MKRFKWAIVVAMLTTLFSVILILVGMSLDYDACQSVASTPPFQFSNLILSLGTFMFGFGGHAVFPTIQHDMKNPGHFTYSAILAFCIVTAMYAPISMLGYVTYGDSLEESIINSIQVSLITSLNVENLSEHRMQKVELQECAPSSLVNER
uniref:Amino acid transporter transmembrane domain-containing protein n=1 Tax=Parascaris equorum TaxID=6256 RepID=A0A914R6U9_PAREQ